MKSTVTMLEYTRFTVKRNFFTNSVPDLDDTVVIRRFLGFTAAFCSQSDGGST